MDQYCKELFELRKAAKLTREQLGEKVNLRPISIYRIETGKTKDIDTIRRVALALGRNLRIVLDPAEAALEGV